MEKKVVRLEKVDTKKNNLDFLTKAFTGAKFEWCSAAIGLKRSDVGKALTCMKYPPSGRMLELANFAGHLERTGVELGQNKSGKESPYLQNGYSNELEENILTDLPRSAHQRLLIVLSNIGYCKDELSHELYNKYRQIWLQSMVKDEGDSDIQDLVISFSGLEEKILERYTFAKVYAGAKPLLERILGVLVEGSVDTFLSLFNENTGKELRSLYANGFCQLMLELEYFEFVLNPYFTADARESLKSLQGRIQNNEDALADERQQGIGVSPGSCTAIYLRVTMSRAREDSDQHGMLFRVDCIGFGARTSQSCILFL